MSTASSRTLVLRVISLLVPLLFGAASALGQVSVTTQHNDAARTGANLSETVLNTGNVNVNSFGKLFERAVDNQVYGQPLYVANVAIPGVGTRNVVYVATVNNSVYAFDADSPAATAPLWQVNYNNPAAGIVPVDRTDVGQACGNYLDFSGSIGVVGTPVVDAASQTIYLVARTKENGTFVQRLHALDLATGAERPGSPLVIQASVPGTGDGHDAQNMVPFNARTENQRPGLLLMNGIVYIAWASHCDQGPYHGWVIGYNATTLQQVVVYNTSPNGGLAGIWQSGQGPAADASGNIYAITGNGSFDGEGGASRGNSFIKLSPAGVLLDWFTPYNWSFLNSIDADLGAAGAMVLPDTNLVIGGGKQGILYVVNRSNMGHNMAGSDNQIVQSFQASTGGRIDGSPVYWNTPNNGPVIYLWAENDPLKAFRFNGTTFQTTPIAQSTARSAGMPGGMLSLTANGSTAGTGILWATLALNGSANHTIRPGILRAYDASDITRELYNSEQNAARDSMGNFAKFSFPTIANGKVYVATFSNKLVVYGLLNPGGNQAPLVNAGSDQSITLPASASLSGTGSDDGLPNPPATATYTWSKVSGPGTVTFGNANALSTTASFSAAGAYVLRLTGSDSALTATDDVSITVNPVGSGGGGTGLVGQYFNDPGNGTYFNTLVLRRTDATVNYDWAGGSPASGVNVDNFSIRWTGQVLAPVTGSYTFYTTSDDGVRLWINGQLVIDKWIDQSATTWPSAAVALTGGTKYDVRMEFYEKGGDAVAKLLWSYPNQAQQPIPQSQLFTTNQPAVVNAGPDQTITLPSVAQLSGTGSDDGLPNPPGAVTYTWSKISGREDGDGGTVVFGNSHALSTTATFGASGPYVLRLTANDGAISSSDDITIIVNDASPTTGTGLTAQYFNDPGNGTFFNALALTRVDATVNNDWGNAAPAAGVTADNFSVRWTGQVQAPVTGSYTFYTTSDDGVRLWVNGQQIVNNWTDHGATTNTSTAVTLTAGVKYDIRMEFYEKGGLAVAKLLWSYPGQAQQVIPQTRLFPTSGTGTGLTGRYYNDAGNGTFFTTLALTRIDATVNYDWGSGSPATGVQANNFSARWTGQVQAPVSGVYTFYTTTDDGVRLWVNGVLILDRWIDQSPTTNTSTTIALTAGTKYDIKLEYYEKGGGAVAKLLWSYPGQAQQIVPQIRLFP